MLTLDMVIAPRINPNDEYVQLVEIVAKTGMEINKDDLIMVIESSKATYNIMAKAKCKIKGYHFSEGEMIKVGDTICDIIVLDSG